MHTAKLKEQCLLVFCKLHNLHVGTGKPDYYLHTEAGYDWRLNAHWLQGEDGR